MADFLMSDFFELPGVPFWLSFYQDAEYFKKYLSGLRVLSEVEVCGKSLRLVRRGGSPSCTFTASWYAF